MTFFKNFFPKQKKFQAKKFQSKKSMKTFDKIDDVTKAMMIIYMLALCKNLKANDLPKHIIWQLNAYTNWNLILIVCRYLYSLDSLDPFLFVNSLGILTAFKTGFCQGLDQNIRKS